MPNFANSNETYKIKVIFFASLREHIKSANVVVRMNRGDKLPQLIQRLIHNYPTIEDILPAALIAVNKELPDQDYILRNGDEVSFFPPVAGG
jgi:molybdopterin converting factor subunit 1